MQIKQLPQAKRRLGVFESEAGTTKHFFCFWLPCVPFISPVSKARPLLRKPAREFVRDPDVRKDWPLALIDQFSLLAHAHRPSQRPPRSKFDFAGFLRLRKSSSITFPSLFMDQVFASMSGLMPATNPFPHTPLARWWWWPDGQRPDLSQVT